MTDKLNDAALDESVRAADPLGPDPLPSAADTEAALRMLLATGPASPKRAGLEIMGRRLANVRRRLAASTAAVAALATTAALIFGVTTSSPAFAVTRNPNGTVTVWLAKLSGVPGANHKLATMGVRATIVTAMNQARYVASLHPCAGQPAGTVRTITFDPSAIPMRQTLLLAADRAAHLGYYSASVRAGASIPTASLTPATAFQGTHTPIARARALAAAARNAGNSGTGNTGTGNTGNTGATPGAGTNRQIRVYCGQAVTWPAGGATGNTGAGNTGTGNTGTGNTGQTSTSAATANLSETGTRHR
jgi:hypothetical protein